MRKPGTETKQKGHFTERDSLLGRRSSTGRHHSEPLWRQYLATLIASLISMGTGCAGGWSASAVPQLMSGSATDFGLMRAVSADEASWITSLLILGCLVGSIPAGILSHYFGRRKYLIYLGILLIFSWLLIIQNSNNIGFIYVGRFLNGFVGGSVCIALAMYSNEVCSDPIRGRSGSFYDMMQVFGILFVYVMTATNNLYWASIYCMCIPIIFLCLFYAMPESPLHLVRLGRRDEAIECIRWLHGDDCDIEKELTRRDLALLEGRSTNENKETHDSAYYVAIIRKFFNGISDVTMKTFTLVLILFVIQRSCGAPIVVYYAVDVFEFAHSNISATKATVYSGIAQFVCSAIGIALIDRVGRRLLLIFSFGIMATSLCTFIAYLHFASTDQTVQDEFGWIPVLTISIFVGVFRLGVGPIPWFMCAELLPTKDQRWALPIVLFIAWGVAFVCTKVYLGAVAAFGYVTVFTFFIVINLAGLFETVFLLPETKNKSRIEIQEELGSSTFIADLANRTDSEKVLIIEN